MVRMADKAFRLILPALADVLIGGEPFRTDGRTYHHPYQEASEAAQRLLANAAPPFDELLMLRVAPHLTVVMLRAP
jgi:hypothetical protein